MSYDPLSTGVTSICIKVHDLEVSYHYDKTDYMVEVLSVRMGDYDVTGPFMDYFGDEIIQRCFDDVYEMEA